MVKKDDDDSTEFLITQLKHDFDQAQRQHRMTLSVVKDSIGIKHKNSRSSNEPRGKRGKNYVPIYT